MINHVNWTTEIRQGDVGPGEQRSTGFYLFFARDKTKLRQENKYVCDANICGDWFIIFWFFCLEPLSVKESPALFMLLRQTQKHESGFRPPLTLTVTAAPNSPWECVLAFVGTWTGENVTVINMRIDVCWHWGPRWQSEYSRFAICSGTVGNQSSTRFWTYRKNTHINRSCMYRSSDTHFQRGEKNERVVLLKHHEWQCVLW